MFCFVGRHDCIFAQRWKSHAFLKVGGLVCFLFENLSVGVCKAEAVECHGY